jgi:hypothetical protein
VINVEASHAHVADKTVGRIHGNSPGAFKLVSERDVACVTPPPFIGRGVWYWIALQHRQELLGLISSGVKQHGQGIEWLFIKVVPH